MFNRKTKEKWQDVTPIIVRRRPTYLCRPTLYYYTYEMRPWQRRATRGWYCQEGAKRLKTTGTRLLFVVLLLLLRKRWVLNAIAEGKGGRNSGTKAVVSDRKETEYGNLQLGLLSDHRINGLGDLIRDGAAKQAVSDRNHRSPLETYTERRPAAW
jgi:hypothetical protein